jgi:hypothetical protein
VFPVEPCIYDPGRIDPIGVRTKVLSPASDRPVLAGPLQGQLQLGTVVRLPAHGPATPAVGTSAVSCERRNLVT